MLANLAILGTGREVRKDKLHLYHTIISRCNLLHAGADPRSQRSSHVRRMPFARQAETHLRLIWRETRNRRTERMFRQAATPHIGGHDMRYNVRSDCN
jgi:hypothetical protein